MTTQPHARLRALLLLLLTYAGFISLGLPDGMLGVAWPSMRGEFALPLDAVSAVLMTFMAGYLCSTLASGWLLARMHVGWVLMLSGAVTALGLLGYASAPAWWAVVALSLVSGLGAGAIDTGLNTYAALNYSARTMNWLHACYGIGAASGPVLLTMLLSHGESWRRGYLLVGLGEMLLAGCFLMTLSWWPRAQPASEASGSPRPADLLGSLRQDTVWLGIVTFFVYTGVEAAVGTWAYTYLTRELGVSAESGGHWAGAYWGSLTAGRILAGFAAGAVGPRAMIFSGAGLILMGALMTVVGWGSGAAIAGILAIGLGCAPIFPSLISTTPARVPAEHTAHAVGFQIAAATLGIALVPSLIGFVAERQGLWIIPVAWLGAAALLFVFLTVLLRTRPVAAPTASREPDAP